MLPVLEPGALFQIADIGVLHRVLGLLRFPEDGQGGAEQGVLIPCDKLFQPVGVFHALTSSHWKHASECPMVAAKYFFIKTAKIYPENFSAKARFHN